MSVEVVARIKAELEARGVSLVGPCGAFAIVKRVAWELRATGAGVLAKTNGANCEGFAVDIIAFPDGRIFDVLIRAGGDEYPKGHALEGQPIPGTGNGPAWNPPSDGLNVDPLRWHFPTDPGDPKPAPVVDAGGASGPGETPGRPPAGELAGQVLAALATTNARLTAVGLRLDAIDLALERGYHGRIKWYGSTLSLELEAVK